MNNFVVFASANSRLHADIILVRLRRAEIDYRKVSVLFPANSIPNAVGCWLPVASNSKLRAGREIIVCAGLLRKHSVGSSGGHDDGREILDLLTQAGVDAPGADTLAERLGQGHIILGVHAANETQAAVAWHVFRHSCADSIVVNSLQPTHRGSRHRENQVFAPWVPAAA